MPPRTNTVTLVSNNLSSGGALACATLARALRPHFDVQVMGTTFGPDLWPGIREVDFEIEAFPGTELPDYLGTVREMVSRIRGDAVIAHQFRLSSYGVGLLHRFKTGKPLVAYVDDDDIALTMPGRAAKLRRRLVSPNGDLPTRLMYRLRGRADATFCGSEYFSRSLGGITIPLGRDGADYSADRFDRHAVRRACGIEPDEFVVGFIGNPRPHVGFEDLLAALELLGDAYTLLVAPTGTLSAAARDWFERSSIRPRLLENQPSTRVPELLAAADAVVVPQRKEQSSLGQLPARLVEAMAMGKPIVTTRLSDIPAILDDGGLYVEERDPSGIAAALAWLREHPSEGATLGVRARQRFEEKLSLDAMTRLLVPHLAKLIDARLQRQAN